jgi:L-ascorbate metabolism protein UlaG (beta-lactamase superfamily)
MAETSERVRCTFFGTSSLYLTDGTTGIFIDAFLTRPSLSTLEHEPIKPDIDLIKKTLERGAVKRLDALFVAHSHYDHVMDSPEVIKLLGGKLYGSPSTLNVGKGAGLPDASMQTIDDNSHHAIGAFHVRVLQGEHSPGNIAVGTIDAPLKAPANVLDYRDGGCYSFYISHPSGSVLIHPSANFVAGKFVGLKPYVLYLGVGMLGAQSRQFQDDYWRHTVEATQPKLILPVHWDHFGLPLSEPLRPLPEVLDKFEATKEMIKRKVREGAWNVRWQGAFETIDLFEGGRASS